MRAHFARMREEDFEPAIQRAAWLTLKLTRRVIALLHNGIYAQGTEVRRKALPGRTQRGTVATKCVVTSHIFSR